MVFYKLDKDCKNTINTINTIKNFFLQKKLIDNNKKHTINIDIYKESFINKYFDQIYVINLPKQLNRKVTIISQFNKLGIKFKFIDGINGLDPKYIKLWKNYKIKPGLWGYYMVMINIFKDAIKLGYKSIVVFDDDVVFHKNFQYINKTLEDLLKKPWLTILLGASEQSWNNYNNEIIKNNGYYTPKITDGSFAICYNYPSFHYLLNECIKFKGTYDSYTLRSLYEKYPNNCFVIYPNIVIADVSNSNLRERRNMIEECNKFRWNLDDYNYYSRGEPITIFIYFKDQINKLVKLIPKILKQDYTNIHIKILDDCSKNKIYCAIKQLENKFDNIKIIQNQYPMGYLPTLKNAIDACENKYIFILDIEKCKIEDNLISTLLSYYLVEDCDQPILLKPVDYKSVFSPKKFLRLSWRSDLKTMEKYLKNISC